MSLSDKLRKIKPRKWKLRPEVLLCENIPKPLHGVAPREILGTPWWNETRQAAYRSTGYCCIACGVHKSQARSRQWMEGHELYEIDYVCGRMLYIETVPLCHFCHNYIHDGRMRALLVKREFPSSKYTSIIQHGDRVLANAGLEKMPYNNRENFIINELLEGRVAKWQDWRLVLNGKEYPPKFKTPTQWKKAFAR